MGERLGGGTSDLRPFIKHRHSSESWNPFAFPVAQEGRFQLSLE
jgi:hypothetical protein